MVSWRPVAQHSHRTVGHHAAHVCTPQDHGKTSATASLGLITLWDVEGGLPQIDKYLYSQDPAVVAGALLGVGIINSSVQVSPPAIPASWYELLRGRRLAAQCGRAGATLVSSIAGGWFMSVVELGSSCLSAGFLMRCTTAIPPAPCV